jgi:hypothetical protein
VTDEIILPTVASRYEQCMAVIEDRGQLAMAATMEMWAAMLEIYNRKLWQARFHTTEEWLDYINEMGYVGLSRSSMYRKLSNMQNLILGGVSLEIAAAAVTSVPGAVDMIASPAELQSVVGELDTNEYVKRLTFLQPGEAVKQVRSDKGQSVEMWLKEVRLGVRPGEVIALVVRSDGKRGYTAYDVHVTIAPQIPGNQDMLSAVTHWFAAKIGGHLATARLG